MTKIEQKAAFTKEGVLWSADSLRTASLFGDAGFKNIVNLTLKIGRQDKTVTANDLICHPVTLRRNIDVAYTHMVTLVREEVIASIRERIPPAFTTDLTSDDTT